MTSQNKISIHISTLVVFWEHDRQDRLSMITRTHGGQDVDFVPMAWLHEKQHDEFDSICASHGAGGNQSTEEQVLESSLDGLPFTFQTSRWRHVFQEQVVRDTRVHLESDSFRLLGNINQHPVFNGLLPRVAGDDFPIFVHFGILPIGIIVNSWEGTRGRGGGHGIMEKTELRRRNTYFGPERDSPVILGPGWTFLGRPGENSQVGPCPSESQGLPRRAWSRGRSQPIF